MQTLSTHHMTITIRPLTEVHPSSGFELNSTRCSMLANAGIGFLRACAAVDTFSKIYGHNFHTPLPLMHQAIELLVKAHASLVDAEFSPKGYGHKTVKIVREYSSQIEVFSDIASNTEHMDLIAGLEQAWLSVRYGEAFVSYSAQDYKNAANIANLLSDKYFYASGTPLQAHHFEELKNLHKQSDA